MTRKEKNLAEIAKALRLPPVSVKTNDRLNAAALAGVRDAIDREQRGKA
jgi:hypothetical protein